MLRAILAGLLVDRKARRRRPGPRGRLRTAPSGIARTERTPRPGSPLHGGRVRAWSATTSTRRSPRRWDESLGPCSSLGGGSNPPLSDSASTMCTRSFTTVDRPRSRRWSRSCDRRASHPGLSSSAGQGYPADPPPLAASLRKEVFAQFVVIAVLGPGRTHASGHRHTPR